MDNLPLSRFAPEQSPTSSNKPPSGLHAKLLRVISTPAVEKRRDNSTLLLGFLSPTNASKPVSLTPSNMLHARQTPMEFFRPSEINIARNSSFGSLGSPTLLPVRNNSTSHVPGHKLSENTSQLSSVASRSTKMEARAKLKSRLGKNREDEVKIDPEKDSQNRDDKRVGSTFLSPRTLGAHYNYHSQHLTFIPEKIGASPANKTSFLGFNELAKTVNSTHQSILGNLVMEDVSLQINEGQAQSSEKKLEVLKKKLEFNRLQKDAYDSEIQRQHKERMLPLVKIEQDRQIKEKQMKHLKVLPSQSFYYQTHGWDNVLHNTTLPEPGNTSISNMKSIKEKSVKTEQSIIENTEAVTMAKAAHKYRFFWYQVDENPKAWVPDAREGHTFTTIGKHVVLYGGFSNGTKSEIAIYSPGRNVWKQPEIKGDTPLNGRHGHTACAFKDCVIIFGGEEILGKNVRFREYLNDTRAFYPDKGEWKYIYCPGKTIGPRRNHSATIHGGHMFVYGGLTAQGNYLNELWTFNLKSNSWAQLAIGGPGIAFHQMCACFLDKNLSMIQKAKGAPKSIEEGLYVFGGKDEEGKCLNTLKYLDPNSKPLQWKYPSVRGNPPAERFGHTMLFFQPLSLLVIYGGRNNFFNDPDKIMELNDIRVLNLETMSWNPTYAQGDVPQIPRSNHAASLYGNVMIIFGGLGFKEYMPVQVRIVELNQRNAKKLIEENERQQRENETNHQSTGTFASVASNPTFLKGILVEEKKEKKEGVVSFLPVPSELTEEKTLKLKGTLKGAVTKVRILENWKKLKSSIKNQKDMETMHNN